MRWKRVFSVSDRNEMWERWRRGETLSEISRVFGQWPASIRSALLRNGGIAPAQRTRREGSLTLTEREEISRGLAIQESMRAIAKRLGRHASSVSREVNSNGGPENYRASAADERAWCQAKRPKRCKLATHGPLRREVAARLASRWSPEQIAGSLKQDYPGIEAMQISHETIYRSLYVQARGVLKKELQEHLRLSRAMRLPKKSRSRQLRSENSRATQIPDAVKISERPASVEDRAVPGHWEGDLLCGTGNSQLVTLVERQTRYVMLAKADNKSAEAMTEILRKLIAKLPQELKRSLTWDRGTEMANHKEFTLATNVDVYFCDPQSPWQRGTNENTNGLLRQYFPKKTSVAHITQAQLNAVARELNGRPRKTLDYRSPARVFAELVAKTG